MALQMTGFGDVPGTSNSNIVEMDCPQEKGIYTIHIIYYICKLYIYVLLGNLYIILITIYIYIVGLVIGQRGTVINDIMRRTGYI
jgi:hypothetical protein